MVGVKVINDKNEIQNIISNKIIGKRVIFSDYYYFGLDKRGLSHEMIKEIFPQFEKITSIEVETLKYGDLGYELFYELSNNTTFSIATCPQDKNVIIIHAIEYKRSLDKRLKRGKKI
jgi:hypothetical protein